MALFYDIENFKHVHDLKNSGLSIETFLGIELNLHPVLKRAQV